MICSGFAATAAPATAAIRAAALGVAIAAASAVGVARAAGAAHAASAPDAANPAGAVPPARPGAAASAAAIAPAPSPVAALEQRAARDGIDAVNHHLMSRAGAAERAHLGRQVASCEPDALRLGVRLGRGHSAQAVQLQHDALRAAAGRCVGSVLSLLSPREVPKICASRASWSVAHTARELRRRIAELDADDLLLETANGRACRAAYWHELTTTRVVVRRATPAASRP